MHAMRLYALKCDKFEKLCLNHDQWRRLAQFELVMRPGVAICFDSQGDYVEIAG